MKQRFGVKAKAYCSWCKWYGAQRHNADQAKAELLAHLETEKHLTRKR